MAKFFRGDKRRREMDRKRRGEQKAERLRQRREMRARGLDPDVVDEEGNPLPLSEDHDVEEMSDEMRALKDAFQSDKKDSPAPARTGTGPRGKS